MKEERADSRSSINSDVSVTSNLSSDRETPDQILKTSSPVPAVNNKSKLSFGISRFLNNEPGSGSSDKSRSQTRVTSDTDDDAKSFHSSASGQVEESRGNVNHQTIPGSHPLNQLMDMRGLQSHLHHPGQLGHGSMPFPTSAFPWFGNPSKYLFTYTLILSILSISFSLFPTRIPFKLHLKSMNLSLKL